jgi:hypothetical protein
LQVIRTKLFAFAFFTARREARRAYYAIFFVCKPLIFLIFYKLARLSIFPLSRLTPARQGRALYESNRTRASFFEDYFALITNTLN